MKRLADQIRTLNATAIGDAHADLIISGATLANVYTGKLEEGIDIAIAGDRVAYVGRDAAHTAGPKTRTEDARGRFVVPGMADPHIHIDQFVTPHEFAEHAVLHGVTTLFSDPIDIVSVCGYRGFVEFLRQCKDAPARIFNVVPGGLPVDRKFSTSRRLTRAQERTSLKRDDVVGLGEVFSWKRVTDRDPQTMAQLKSILQKDHVINGHTAGASGKKLQAYVASGIFSCHEPIDYAQTLERLRIGMWVMIREGSIIRSLKEIVTEVLADRIDTSRLMFCSDGVSPTDMVRYGHIDHCVRQAVSLGMDPVTAYTIASRNAFDYYLMSRDVGGIAPGKLADIVVLDDLQKASVRDVYVGGRRVVHGGRLVRRTRRPGRPTWTSRTVRVGRAFDDDDFAVCATGPSCVNTIVMKTPIITGAGSATLEPRDGTLCADADSQVLKAANFERARPTHKGVVAFVEGLGRMEGALATTWSFHENDLVVVGSNERDMAAAANIAASRGGGIVFVRNAKRVADIRLDFAGILSTMSFEKVAESLERLDAKVHDAGCRFSDAHLVPLFLPFLALPSVRLLHTGMVDIKSSERIPTVAHRLK